MKIKIKIIGNKYEACLRHFFKNHQRIPHKLKLEVFVPIKINNILIQAYVRCYTYGKKRR